MLDAGGAGSGPDGEAYSGFPAAAEGGAGDASGGAKSESMRRSVAGVDFTVGGGEGSRVVFLGRCGVGCLQGVFAMAGARARLVRFSARAWGGIFGSLIVGSLSSACA